jgi:hypothetical protein
MPLSESHSLTISTDDIKQAGFSHMPVLLKLHTTLFACVTAGVDLNLRLTLKTVTTNRTADEYALKLLAVTENWGLLVSNPKSTA